MKHTFTAADSDAGIRLDLFLLQRLAEFSRSRLQSWIKDGHVLVNGAAAKASMLLRGGESIEVTPANLPPLKAEAEDLPLDILYQDDAVIAVNKPAGLVVHAGAGSHSGTLVNRLVHHFQALSQVGGDLRPGIVHRLDKGTSGVLLVARTDAAHQALAAQFSSLAAIKFQECPAPWQIPHGLSSGAALHAWGQEFWAAPIHTSASIRLGAGGPRNAPKRHPP